MKLIEIPQNFEEFRTPLLASPPSPVSSHPPAFILFIFIDVIFNVRNSE